MLAHLFTRVLDFDRAKRYKVSLHPAEGNGWLSSKAAVRAAARRRPWKRPTASIRRSASLASATAESSHRPGTRYISWRATGNVPHVESRNSSGGRGDDIDDFSIDNVVILYKIRDFSWTLPAATGDFAAFVKTELLPSIRNVRGSGATADPADQHNEYVLPTVSQLASWRAVFQSLLAGAWGPAHLQARMISSTYNVVQFLDTPTGRTYYVLMEGVPGQIPAPASHPSGVTIIDPADPTRRGWGTYVFDAQPQRALSLSAPHPKDDLETADEAVEAYLALGARTLLIAGADRDQNTALAPCDQSNRPYLEADVGHTAESVFQMAFEEIYSSDASTWHLQFHGNATCREDLFLSNGVDGRAGHALCAQSEHRGSLDGRSGGRARPQGRRLRRGGRLRPSGDGQHADEVRLGPAAREHLPDRQRPGGAFAVHSRGAAPRRAARPDRPFGHARAEPRRGRGRDPGDVSLRGDLSPAARR